MQQNVRIGVITILSLALIGAHWAATALYSVPVLAADHGAVPLSSDTIADVAEKASPAVVRLESRPNPSTSISEPPPVELGPNPDITSGFIIRSDGHILTNYHCVMGKDSIKVFLFDNRSFDARVVGTDPFSDLAVLKIDAKDLPTLPWGKSSAVRVGEFAVAIGSSLGEKRVVTLGIISAINCIEHDVNGNITFIQTDAAINRGDSGSPLLNLNGEVVGINSAIRTNAQNVSYSIPADIASNVADMLIVSGKIVRSWLGITLSELDEANVKAAGLPADTKGVLIKDFSIGSPALAAGLKKNDIIQKIDGKEMLVPKDVKDHVHGRKVGDVLTVLVLRDKKTVSVAVKLIDYPRRK